MDIYTLKRGDKVAVTRDGKTTIMEVWNVLEPGSAGRAVSAGPWIMARVRPGGYGMGFDQGTIAAGFVTIEKVEK